MIQWSMRKLPTGDWAGMITMMPTPGAGQWSPTHPAGKPIRLVAQSKTKAGALAKAASVAQLVANNPLLASVLPPGSGVAINAIAKLAKSAAAGKLESAAKKYGGKGAKRLVKALKKFW